MTQQAREFRAIRLEKIRWRDIAADQALGTKVRYRSGGDYAADGVVIEEFVGWRDEAALITPALIADPWIDKPSKNLRMITHLAQSIANPDGFSENRVSMRKIGYQLVNSFGFPYWRQT
jgi:hypothetical protein